jgi:hypothetical protein
MHRIRSFAHRKAHSLVFSITESFPRHGDFGSPEPRFAKWAKHALDLDTDIAGDNAMSEELPAQEAQAWRLFHDAMEATSDLLALYRKEPALFQKVARQLSLLPCLMSWHPDAERFNRRLFEFSKLGEERSYGEWRQHAARQSWPVRYAYAIMATIDLTLDMYEDRLPEWAETYGYGIRHPIPLSYYREAAERTGWGEAKKLRELRKYRGSYWILPAWTKSLQKLRRPFNMNHVLDYWRTGKQMIREEMPGFQDRSEWADYRNKRAYQHGAKPGAVRNAIFKDILAALKTIAGANHRRKLASSVK